MAKYTRRGSDQLDAQIDVQLRHVAELAAPHSIAGILLGGYGRGEGTPFINPDGTQSPFNDYDLVVIVEPLNRDVRQLFKTLEQQLTAELGIPVDLCPYEKSLLSRCECSLLNYEMKHGHKVIWGDEHILDAMPDYPAGKLPLSEGSRLLLNRGKLLLDIKQRIMEAEPLTHDERIRFIKFIQKAWLAMGDCALLAKGKYDLSYGVKRERIATLQDIPDRDAIVDHYVESIQLKEKGDYLARLPGTDIAAEFQFVCSLYLSFFHWYQALHTGRECSMIKAMLLNLKWNGRPLLHHPRKYLYSAIQELLKEEPGEFRLREMLFCRSNFVERFYAMQKRFS